MDVKVLLAKCISLLYREAEVDEHNNSSGLVMEVIQSLKINTDISGTDGDINELKNISINMMGRESPIPYQDLIQHIKIACGNNTNLFESIQDNIAFEMDKEETKRVVLSYRFELGRYLRNKKAQDKLDKISYNLKFNKDQISDINAYLSTELNSITELINYSGEEIPGVVVELDLDDVDAVAEQYDLIRQESDGSRVLKTPWQALNRMTRGGLRLGQLTIVGGLAHNNKTGVCLSLFISACMFNNPNNLLTDKSKKPINVLFSFEDDMQIVLSNIYTLLKGNLENVVITDDDKKKLNKHETARYVRDMLQSTGYSIRLVRINPSEWSYIEIQNKILEIESQGYEVHMCLIDYLNLANKNGLSNLRGDSDVQELFRRTKNFMCAGHNIALVTPHQLSGDALDLKRQGNKMLAQQVSDGSYYADCRGLYREPELEILIDIVKDNGKKYQAFARGKHRGQNDTPEEHKFFILPFAKVGGLRWDINGQDTSLSRFGASRNEDGDEELAFYDIPEQK